MAFRQEMDMPNISRETVLRGVHLQNCAWEVLSFDLTWTDHCAGTGYTTIELFFFFFKWWACLLTDCFLKTLNLGLTIDMLKPKEITNYYCNYCLCHRHTVRVICVVKAFFFCYWPEGSFSMLLKISRSTHINTETKKKERNSLHRHIICMSSVIETMWITWTKHFFMANLVHIKV